MAPSISLGEGSSPADGFTRPVYCVRPLGRDVFEVAKFEGHASPAQVYRVTLGRGGSLSTCSCPGFQRRQDLDHKHVQLVKVFQELGSPELASLWFEPQGEIRIYQPTNTREA